MGKLNKFTDFYSYLAKFPIPFVEQDSLSISSPSCLQFRGLLAGLRIGDRYVHVFISILMFDVSRIFFRCCPSGGTGPDRRLFC